ncbi:ornithine cyclodeaminase [Alkaliphilus transvaalensis]|uniref:ornithine cyclodeaminase n=1 Tax=Alkaliphilus transvaalensis TaxID=114628 RepID=UPI000478AFC3|nr:ornithine cyclodeaminase [Alkaliphilus transvaalensis]
MLYLNESDINNLGITWNELVTVIEKSVACMAVNDFAQPIKPYLRYRDLKNRIIAMPAFIGGEIEMSGIKWIASFPDNIKNNLPRAHSVVILNNASTGEPLSIINTALLSILRTSAVSGALIKAYDNTRTLKGIKIGIVGWGPIGQYHFKMVNDLLGDKIEKVYIYDIKPLGENVIDSSLKDKIEIVDSWEKTYIDADIFMTCTVSKEPYIDLPPKKGSLQLNVSLRDYKTDILDYVKNALIVDDWDEVCREKTDIEHMHIEKGLKQEDSKSIIDVVCNDFLTTLKEEDVIMFNPMGMATFDIALGGFFYNKAKEMNIGKALETL